MHRSTRFSMALAALGVSVAPLAAQQAPVSPAFGGFKAHLGVEIGASLFGISATRSVMIPTAEDYVLNARAVVDPLGRFRADLGATLRPGNRLSYSAYATASSLDNNRFYGWGNQTEAAGGTPFHRLEQLRIETGLQASLRLGPERNRITAGPFYRMLQTDRELGEEPGGTDDGGVMRLLSPYGSGSFRQLGLRTDLRLSTEGPEAGKVLGVRFYGGGTAYAAALDMREPVFSMYGDAKAFVRLPAPGRPVLYVRGALQKVIGDYPFQDAAYLGGRNSLRGFEKQRFAGDFSVLWSGELYQKVARLRVRHRPITAGVMLLADLGRVYDDGVSVGSSHVAAGGGLWFRDEITGTEVTISVVEGGLGPRLYVGLGSAFWR